MRDDVIAIEVGHEVLLLGRFDALLPNVRQLQQPGRALTVLPRLASMPSAMARLRKYWADHRSPQAVINLSDHDVLKMVGAAIDNGQLQAVVASQPSFTLGSADARRLGPVKFSRYATWWIRQAITRSMNSRDIIELVEEELPAIKETTLFGATIYSFLQPTHKDMVFDLLRQIARDHGRSVSVHVISGTHGGLDGTVDPHRADVKFKQEDLDSARITSNLISIYDYHRLSVNRWREISNRGGKAIIILAWCHSHDWLWSSKGNNGKIVM
jgi:hypothetical protein